MTSGDEVFRRLQRLARSVGTRSAQPPPTQELLIRHTIESFLERLTRTGHGEDFVLKGGVLLAAYGARRPTRDVDSNAVSADVTAEHLKAVVQDVAAVPIDDGVEFDASGVSVTEIRETSAYPGFRVRIPVSIGPWRSMSTWDVSTGDPIVPPPTTVTIDRLLGSPIVLRGYRSETVIAEKGVTILERGITSTRWRDYIDIVEIARRGFDPDALFRASSAVAEHRGVELRGIGPLMVGYGRIGQAKWQAWRRKEHLETASEPDLDTQIAIVASYLDPVFTRTGP